MVCLVLVREDLVLTTDVTHIEWHSDTSVEILYEEPDVEIADEYYEMMNHINLNYSEDEDLD